MKDKRTEYSVSKKRVHIDEDEDNIIYSINNKGSARVMHFPKYSEDFHISEIKVQKRFRGKGIGTQLLNEIIKDADSKCAEISVFPETKYGPAYKERLVKYYSRFGFTIKNIDIGVDEMVRSPKCNRSNLIKRI